MKLSARPQPLPLQSSSDPATLDIPQQGSSGRGIKNQLPVAVRGARRGKRVHCGVVWTVCVYVSVYVLCVVEGVIFSFIGLNFMTPPTRDRIEE